MRRDPADRRARLIGEQQDLGAAPMRHLGQAQEHRLVAADVEHDDDVARDHVEQVMRPDPGRGAELGDAGAHHLEMGEEKGGWKSKIEENDIQ